MELRQKYGRPSRATGDDKQRYEILQTRLASARQKHRRKVFRMLYRDHFVESDERELQNQLQGIHNPVVERQITRSLPERQLLADILGDMDEDLSEEDIVGRKVEAINAMVAYAYKSDPFTRAQPERVKPVPTPSPEAVLATRLPAATARRLPAAVSASRRQPIAPNLTGPTQNTRSPFMLETPSRSPPPPYSEFDSGAGHPPQIVQIRRRPYVRKRPDPCILCRKRFI